MHNLSCQFHLDRATPVYYTDEQISGTFTLAVGKKPALLEGIAISLLGVTTTNWSEATADDPQIEHNDCSRQTKPTRLQFGGKETHINEGLLLSGPIALGKGTTQVFNFSFILPHSLPASCHLENGSITYALQVRLERRSKQTKCFEQRLVIKKRVELTELRPQVIRNPNLTLRLPRTTFVPGQRVFYELQMKDLSALEYRVQLCQRCIYQSFEPQMKTKHVIRVLDGSNEQQGNLHLPLSSPIMSDGEKKEKDRALIHISYFIEAIYAIRDQQSVGRISLPLYVGTVVPPSADTSEFWDCGFVNFGSTAVTQNEIITNFNQSVSCSGENNALLDFKKCEQIKLLCSRKKSSYWNLSLRYFYKNILP